MYISNTVSVTRGSISSSINPYVEKPRKKSMRDLKKGQVVVTVSEVSSKTDKGVSVTIPVGRLGVVNEFKRNPKNDAIEKLGVHFGYDSSHATVIVNVDDLQSIERFYVDILSENPPPKS